MTNEESKSIFEQRANDLIAETLPKLTEQMNYMYELALFKRLKFSDRLRLECCKCKVTLMAHTTVMGDSDKDHPFFEDNLRMLEWEDERRHNS